MSIAIKITRVFFVAIIGMVLSFDTILRAEASLTFRTSGILPRSSYFEASGWTGYEVDMVRAIAKNMPAPQAIEFIKTYNWKRSIEGIRHGRFDMMAGVSYRVERAEYMDFIGVFDSEDVFLVTRADQDVPTLDRIDKLTEFEKGIQVDFAGVWHPEFDHRLLEDPAFAAHFVSISISAYKSREDLLLNTAKRLEYGRISGAIMTYYAAAQMKDYVSKKTGEKPLKITRIDVFGAEPTYLVASQKVDVNMRDALKVAYARIRESGEFDKIWSAWYPERLVPEPAPVN